jgi:transcriptional regulator with XRE-family HTH domain
MTLGEKLKSIRQEIGLSQEAIGAQGFVSKPGWIKIENGQRQASEKLIDKLVSWLMESKYVRASKAKELKEELLTLKCLGSTSAFVRELARSHAKGLPGGVALLGQTAAGAKAPLGRPKMVLTH